MPTLLAVLCSLLIGLLALEGTLWALAEGNLFVGAIDIILIALVATAMKPTARGRSNLRAFSVIIGLITLVAEVMTWPPDTADTLMLADFAIQVAVMIVCAALFLALQSPAVSRWYETPR